MTPEPGNVRSLAAGALDRILAAKGSATEPLRQAAEGLDRRDARLLRELVLGSLRWLRRLDSIIESASSRPLKRLDRALLAPLRLGVLQLVVLDRVPAHAAVDQAVREARRRTHRGGAGFTNAVLRRVAHAPTLDRWPVRETDPMRRVAIETSHPDFLVGRWWRHFGEQRTRQLLAANNRRKPAQILAFSQHGGRGTLTAELAADGIETEYSGLAPEGLVVRSGAPATAPAFAQGLFYLQDVASQTAALVPVPEREERVYDVAAAPGGKSFSLLAYEPSVQIVAADSSLPRMRLLIANRDRLRLRAETVVAASLDAPFSTRFDRVILDVPCTGTGTLRKNPELKWRVGRTEIDRLAAQGLEWMRVAAQRVRPGGILSLVTCSIEPEENAGVIRGFLQIEPGFEPLPLAGRVPPAAEAAIAGPGSWQILPGDVHDGFTVHVLRRCD